MSIFRPIIKDPVFHLKRNLRLFETTMAGVGFILGAGIYVLIGAVAELSGTAIWLSFVLAALAAIFSGLSYAELSSIFPVNASEYVYANEGLGKGFGFFSYISIILALTTGIATVSLGFAGYFGALTGIENTLLIAFSIIILFSFLNWLSVKKVSIINLVCTIASIVGLLIIVALAFFKGEPTNYLAMPEGIFGVIKGASLIFFAYLGFEGIVKLSEETKNARKTIPKAILLSIIISTVVYIAVAIAAVKVLPWEILAKSSAPLADVAAHVLGNKAFLLLGIIALLSAANTILMGILSSSRGFYGLGEIFKKFKFFSKIGMRETPTRAIVITSIIAISFLFFEDISIVAGFTNFMVFATFIIINLSLIRLRYKQPHTIRKFKIPFSIGKFPIFPVFGILISLFLLINLETINILLGTLFTIIIVLIYYFLYHKKSSQNI